MYTVISPKLFCFLMKYSDMDVYNINSILCRCVELYFMLLIRTWNEYLFKIMVVLHSSLPIHLKDRDKYIVWYRKEFCHLINMCMYIMLTLFMYDVMEKWHQLNSERVWLKRSQQNTILRQVKRGRLSLETELLPRYQ